MNSEYEKQQKLNRASMNRMAEQGTQGNFHLNVQGTQLCNSAGVKWTMRVSPNGS